MEGAALELAAMVLARERLSRLQRGRRVKPIDPRHFQLWKDLFEIFLGTKAERVGGFQNIHDLHRVLTLS